jgi:hypothetical protein
VDQQPPFRSGPQPAPGISPSGASPSGASTPPQPNRTRNWVLAAAVLIVVFVIGTIYLLTSGSSKGGGSSSEAATVDVGESVELVNTYGDTVEITITRAESKASCGDKARKPETGRYLVADVTVEVTSGKAGIKAADFDFAATAGGWPHRDIGPDFTGCGGTGLGTVANIGSGTKLKGRLVFDVAGPGRIVYHVRTGTTPFGAQWTIK